MKLRDGKKYETADGVVYRVRDNNDGYFDISDITQHLWNKDGRGIKPTGDLIRRHYTKPQPAHKLGLKKGDVVELVAWEDIATIGTGKRFSVLDNGDVEGGFIRLNDYHKSERPLFRVVSRA